MSVLIRGMEMPKNCAECPVGWCNNLILFSKCDKRADNCPLVELPEKHGRLIDADKLIADRGKWYTEEGTEEGFIGTVKDLVDSSPTVIEAAEGGDK